MNKRKRGRPRKQIVGLEVINTKQAFDSSIIKMMRGNDLYFNSSIFEPMKTHSELDTILSTEGGLMPATNMILIGSPGSGKSTIALDMMANLVMQGYKCLFVSAEMDEIAYYKYCRRLPKIKHVPVLFLNNYQHQLKETMEHVFEEGYDVVCIDSIAELIESYKIIYRTTESAAEKWLLELQTKHKKGNNPKNYHTTFINVQQVTKAGEFVGSNRLKHMMDAMMHLDRSRDGLERTIYFSKNRDCDKDFKVHFAIHNDSIHYAYENVNE